MKREYPPRPGAIEMMARVVRLRRTGHTYAAIAAKLGICHGSVAHRIRMARQAGVRVP